MNKIIKFLVDSFDYGKLTNTRQPVIAEDVHHLYKLIQKEIRFHGNKCSLNHIDVSRVIHMNNLFSNSNFNGDISKWDVSNVKDMNFMFNDSKFNGDISNWNVFNVETMERMFNDSNFNGDINNWNVSNVENMNYMFSNSQFNGDISNWRPYNVRDLSKVFEDSKINIPYWAEIDDFDKRNNAISNYHLHNTLNENLSQNTLKPKRAKI